MLKANINRHGIPLIHAETRSPSTIYRLQGGVKTSLGEVTGSRIFCDAGASPGQVTYVLGSENRTVTVGVAGGFYAAGLFAPVFVYGEGDPTEYQSGAAVFTLASGRLAYRLPLEPPRWGAHVRVSFDYGQLSTVRQLVAGGRVVLRDTEPAEGVPAIRSILVESVRTLRDTHEIVAELDGIVLADSIEKPLGVEAVLPAATVGEACRANAKCGESLESIIKRVNGVS